ncbi:MAG: head GIN domain-containing protein [Bernardetiaceae bacterium]
MIRPFFVLLFVLISWYAAAQPITKEIELADFEEIRLSSIVELFLTQSDKDQLRIVYEGFQAEEIVSEVKKGVLQLGTRSKRKHFGKKHYVRAYVSFTTLNKITAGGATAVHIEAPITIKNLTLDLGGATTLKANASIEAQTLELNLSGASDMKVADLMTAQQLTLNLSGGSSLKSPLNVQTIKGKCSGASNAKFSGKAEDQTLTLSGSSNYKAQELTSQTASLNISGASNASVFVQQQLTADASGASDLKYWGKPQNTDLSSSGASKIQARE